MHFVTIADIKTVFSVKLPHFNLIGILLIKHVLSQHLINALCFSFKNPAHPGNDLNAETFTATAE